MLSSRALPSTSACGRAAWYNLGKEMCRTRAIAREAQSEAERLHQDSLQFRQQTQQQCESLIQRSRQEAASVQDGANRYAEQTLGELEQRLKEMSQVVLAGRQELVKIQTGRSETPTPVNEMNESKAVPISRARRSSARMRQMKGTG